MGRVIGTVVLAVFGAVWVNLGLQLAHVSRAWVLPAAIAVAVALILLTFWRGRSRRGPPPPTDRRFVLIGIGGELVLIIVGVNILSAIHRMDLLTPVLAVIVGLHFLPLARGFSAPIYVKTGLAMTAVGLIGFALHGDTRPLVVGLGAAMVLWLTCIVLLARNGRGSASVAPDPG